MCQSEKQKNRLEKAICACVKAKNQRIEQYNRLPNKCKTCGCNLEYSKRKNKFCSHSCAAKTNNLGVIHNRHKGQYSQKPCKRCGKTTKNQYCSKECFLQHRRHERSEEIIKTGNAPNSPQIAKSYLVEMRGRKCEICGLEEWRGRPVPLVLDHINGKPFDNVLSNLRLLCGNCNMQTDTFAGKNIGKGGGRPYRNHRYLEGKSW